MMQMTLIEFLMCVYVRVKSPPYGLVNTHEKEKDDVRQIDLEEIQLPPT